MANKHKDDIDFQYFDEHTPVERRGIEITSVGYQSQGKNSPNPPASHPQKYSFTPSTGRSLQDEFQILYCALGKGVFFSGQVADGVMVSAGDFMILFPDEWHNYYPDPEVGWDIYWIGCRGRYIDEFYDNKIIERQMPVVYGELQVNIVQLFIDSLRMSSAKQPGYEQVLGGITMHLFGLLYANKLVKESGGKTQNRIEVAKIYIQKNIDRRITPEEVADHIFTGYSHFRKTFKASTGVSPARYIRDLRLQRIKHLLTFSNLSIKDIAMQTEFDSVHYFSSYFKKETGLTPSEFAKRAQNSAESLI